MIPDPCLYEVHFHFKKNVCHAVTGNRYKKLVKGGRTIANHQEEKEIDSFFFLIL